MRPTDAASEPRSQRERAWLLGLVLAVALAVLVCFVSNNLNSRFQHRGESIAHQFAILSGDPLLFDGRDLGLREWRSRVLVPVVFATVSQANQVLSVSQWFLVVRLVSAFGALASFWFAVRTTVGGDVRLAAAGLFLIAFEVLFTFNEGWENTTDFPDVAFAALFLWAILGQRRWWLLGLVLLATLNRESSVFAGLIWLVVFGVGRRFSIRWKEIGFGVGLSAIAYVEVLGVRTVMPRPSSAVSPALGTPSDPGYIGQLTHVTSFWNRAAFDVTDFLHHPTPGAWPVLWVGLLTPALVWIWLNRSCVRPLHWRLLLATACMFPITLAYGTLSELREYLPPLVMLAYVAVALEGERTRPAAARGVSGTPPRAEDQRPSAPEFDAPDLVASPRQ